MRRRSAHEARLSEAPLAAAAADSAETCSPAGIRPRPVGPSFARLPAPAGTLAKAHRSASTCRKRRWVGDRAELPVPERRGHHFRQRCCRGVVTATAHKQPGDAIRLMPAEARRQVFDEPYAAVALVARRALATEVSGSPRALASRSSKPETPFPGQRRPPNASGLQDGLPNSKNSVLDRIPIAHAQSSTHDIPAQRQN